MIAGDELPPNSNILRLAKRKDALPENWPLTLAFYLRRESDERELSASWIEYFGELDGEHERMAAACRSLCLDFTPKPNGRVLRIDVDMARELLAANGSLGSNCLLSHQRCANLEAAIEGLKLHLSLAPRLKGK